MDLKTGLAKDLLDSVVDGEAMTSRGRILGLLVALTSKEISSTSTLLLIKADLMIS